MCLDACADCNVMSDFEALSPAERALCRDTLVPYNVITNETDCNAGWCDIATRMVEPVNLPCLSTVAFINMTTGQYGWFCDEDLNVTFVCVICKPGESNLISSLHDMETTFSNSIIPSPSDVNILFVGKMTSNNDTYKMIEDRQLTLSQLNPMSLGIFDPPVDPLIGRLMNELANVLSVDNDNLHLMTMSVVDGSLLVQLLILEPVYHYDEDATFTDFQVMYWYFGDWCLDEWTTAPDGSTIYWRRAQAGVLRSYFSPSTGVTASRTCAWYLETRAKTRSTQWASINYYNVTWTPCNDTQSSQDREDYVILTNKFVQREDYLEMLLWARAQESITLNKTSHIIDVFLGDYFSNIESDYDAVHAALVEAPLNVADYFTEYDILAILERHFVMLELNDTEDVTLFGQGQYNTFAVFNLTRGNSYVGVECIRNEAFENYIDVKPASDIEHANPGTNIKVTVAESLIETNTRLVVGIYVDLNDTQYVNRIHNMLIQVFLHNTVATKLSSDDYVDIWVNNTLEGVNSKRICSSYDFTAKTWSLGNCVKQRSSRNGLDVFRCSRLNHSEGTTSGYFNVYYHVNTMSDYLAQDQAALPVMVIAGIFSAIGLLSILMTAVFYKEWREDKGHKIFLHMIVALVVNLVLGFTNNLVGIDTTSSWCIPIGVLRHYSFLAMYCWLLVTSYLQGRRLTSILGASDTTHLVLKSALFAWGMPLIPISVLLIINPEFYSATDKNRGYCYPEGKALIVTVLTPAGAILALNFLIYILVVADLFDWINLQNKPRITRNIINKNSILINRLSTSCFMFFAFGFTWFFHFLSEINAIKSEFFFEYCFLMAATTHLFILSVFFIFLDKKVRKFWKPYRVCCLLFCPCKCVSTHNNHTQATKS